MQSESTDKTIFFSDLLPETREQAIEYARMLTELVPSFPKQGQSMFKAFQLFLTKYYDHQDELQEQQKARDFCRDISEISNFRQRQIFIRNKLKEIYAAGGNETLDGLISSIGSIKLPIGSEKLILPVQIQYELFIRTIRMLQAFKDKGKKTKPRLASWVRFVRKNISNIESPENNVSIDLRSGKPKDSEKLEKYLQDGIECIDHVPTNEQFWFLVKNFKKLILDNFGDNYEGFVTSGAKKAFLAIKNAMWQKYPNMRLYHTQYEYSPMVQTIEKKQRRSVHISDIQNISEEEIAEKFFYSAEIEETQGHESEPKVILVSSEPREGLRIIDVQRLANVIDKKNKELGKKVYHLWVDAAQDDRLFVHPKSKRNPEYHPDNPDLYIGDVVFWSKLLPHLTLLKKETYPPDEDIAFSLSERSGETILNQAFLKVMFHIHQIRSRLAAQYSDLRIIPDLARFKGTGGFLSSEIHKAQEVSEGLRNFSRHFDIIIQTGKRSKLDWQSHRIIKIAKKTDSDLDIPELVKNLERNGLKKRFQVDSLSIRKHDRIKAIDFEAPLVEFVKQVREAQRYHADLLFEEIIPERITNEAAAKKHVRDVIQRHEAIRINLKVDQKPGTLNKLLETIDDELENVDSN